MKLNRILILIVVLIAAVFAYSFFAPRSEGQYVTVTSGEKEVSLSEDDINGLSSETFTYVLKVKGVKKEITCIGVPLKNILAKAVQKSKYNSVTVTANDGFTVTYDNKEVMEADNIYLVYDVAEKDLSSILPFTVVLKDEFPNRTVKNVTLVEVR